MASRILRTKWFGAAGSKVDVALFMQFY